ncbi:single-stranded-DNA-specific exonuclease RecJ [bacterium]|nr:single-stranded-DNA-specific exonuclease RecJ [bacterium]
MSFAQTRWNFRHVDAKLVERLTTRFRIDPVLAQILIQRGLDDPERVDRFLSPDMKRLADPEAIPGVRDAADAIVEAIRNDRKIIIYADYDVDGVCALTVLSEALRLAGAKHVVPYIPHRIEEGYGLNADAVRTLATEHPGALMVTVDCGITAVEPVALAKSLGLGVIVTDHHTFREELPAADALVHPQLPGGDPFTANLCGAGVAFKLAWQVAKSFGDGKKASPALRDFLVRGLGLVALATVADVMPLVDENRILVKHGLESLNKRRTIGLEALMRFAGVNEDRPVTSTTIGFQIAPRINAAGRMLHAFTAYQLLTAATHAQARELAEVLEESNRTRREVEAAIVAEAKSQFEADASASTRNVAVAAAPGWHAGVIGIAASRLVDAYHRPAIVLSIDDKGVAHGSGRSFGGVNLVEALGECTQHLTTFGGHAAAVGLKLPAEAIDAFRNALDEAIGRRRSDDLGTKQLWIDAEILPQQLDIGLVRAIADLEPHGNGNARPVLAMTGMEIVGEPQLIGQDKKHVRLNMKKGDKLVKVLAWNKAEEAANWTTGTTYDIAFSPSINEWQGRVEVQAELKDLRPHGIV